MTKQLIIQRLVVSSSVVGVTKERSRTAERTLASAVQLKRN